MNKYFDHKESLIFFIGLWVFVIFNENLSFFLRFLKLFSPIAHTRSLKERLPKKQHVNQPISCFFGQLIAVKPTKTTFQIKSILNIIWP